MWESLRIVRRIRLCRRATGAADAAGGHPLRAAAQTFPPQPGSSIGSLQSAARWPNAKNSGGLGAEPPGKKGKKDPPTVAQRHTVPNE